MADTKIKDLTEKATGEATDEFVINAGDTDRKMGMDGLRITESQITDLGSYITASSADTLTNKTLDVEDATNVLKQTTPTLGEYLRDNGTKFVSSALLVADLDTDPLARANHTGTQLVSTISDLGTKAQYDTALSDDNFAYIGQANVFTANQKLNDNIKILLGTGNDTEIYYDGTDLIIDPDAVGGGDLKVDAQQLILTKSNSTQRFVMDRPAILPDGTNIGSFRASALNANSVSKNYAQIFFKMEEDTAGGEDGSIKLNILKDGSSTDFITINDANSGTIELIKPTNVTGNLDTTGTFTAGTYVGQSSIVTLGTITTGVWNGTAITSANLDADTAHLTTNQTFTGVKTFGAAADVGKLVIAGTTSGTTILDATAAASGTLTLPAATDTLMGKSTTDVMINKSYDLGGTGNVLTGSVAEFNTALQSETFAYIGIANAWGTNNQDISSTGKWQEGGTAISPIGIHDIWVGATGMWETTTLPCTALAKVELGTNDIDIQTLDFTSTSADERCQFTITMPRNYNNGAITVTLHWSHSGAATGNVNWRVGAVAVDQSEVLDVAMTFSADFTDAAGTANQLQQVTSASFTPGGTPVDGDQVHFEIMRQGSDVADTFDSTARLHGIVLHITTDTATAA